MRSLKTINFCRKRQVYKLMPFILPLFLSLQALAQSGPPPPPRPIKVTKTQDLSFGTFYQGGAGGTVTILWNGTRSAGGTVVLFGVGGLQAVFSIVANRGTIITFLKPTSTLNDGSGHLLSLQIDTTSPVSPFVTTNNYPTPTIVNMGGILTIGAPAANPPGSYSGTFDITFVQQ
jgi:hypothetical protein